MAQHSSWHRWHNTELISSSVKLGEIVEVADHVVVFKSASYDDQLHFSEVPQTDEVIR
jgi:hypothetical protein